MTEIEVQQIGRVDRVIEPAGKRAYGFIVDGTGKRFFFRQLDCRGAKMPKCFDVVQFFVFKENDPAKNDRAVDVMGAVPVANAQGGAQ